MNTFWILLGVAFLLCGLGVLLSLTLRALARYQEHLGFPALDDNWSAWDAYQDSDSEIEEIKARWEGNDKLNKEKSE